ncbi:hypothetical protein ALP50_02262, partial [Pseudomonas syringae pv. spinaceae]
DRGAALTITATIRMVNPLAEGNEGESLYPRTYESDSRKAHPSVGFFVSGVEFISNSKAIQRRQNFIIDMKFQDPATDPRYSVRLRLITDVERTSGRP